MRICTLLHIVRGDDHLTNTPRQILLFQALGAELPRFAHLPLIFGSDRAPLSKRHGATAVRAYREQGLLAGGVSQFPCASWVGPLAIKKFSRKTS